MSDKDTRDLAESFGRRTIIATGKAHFGLHKISLILGLIHWVQDHVHCSEVLSLDAFDINGDGKDFQAVLDIDHNRAQVVRKVEVDQIDAASKAADPGKFKDERKWPEWEPAHSQTVPLDDPRSERCAIGICHSGASGT